MPTTKPLKSVNLDPADHEMAKKIAQKLTTDTVESAAQALKQRWGVEISPNDSKVFTINMRGAIHYALIMTARELDIE